MMRLGSPALADKVGARCQETLAEAEVVVSGCSACVAQLSATTPDEVAVGHWLELIE